MERSADWGRGPAAGKRGAAYPRDSANIRQGDSAPSTWLVCGISRRSPKVFVTMSERTWQRDPTATSSGTTNQSLLYSSANLTSSSLARSCGSAVHLREIDLGVFEFPEPRRRHATKTHGRRQKRRSHRGHVAAGTQGGSRAHHERKPVQVAFEVFRRGQHHLSCRRLARDRELVLDPFWNPGRLFLPLLKEGVIPVQPGADRLDHRGPIASGDRVKR